jgi:hypothetical protein
MKDGMLLNQNSILEGNFNPSSRRVITRKIFDHGSNVTRTLEELHQFLSSRPSVLVIRFIEDGCYITYEGSEENLKDIASQNYPFLSEDSIMEYYQYGIRTRLKIEIEI